MQGKPPHIALNLFPPDFITFLRHQIAQKSDEVRSEAATIEQADALAKKITDIVN